MVQVLLCFGAGYWLLVTGYWLLVTGYWNVRYTLENANPFSLLPITYYFLASRISTRTYPDLSKIPLHGTASLSTAQNDASPYAAGICRWR
jgi:hypothetical protein